MIHNPQLEGGPFDWPGGPDGIVLIHGFTATVAEVRPLAEHLHAAGYSLLGPLLPGHNTHPQDLNRVRWQDWVEASEAAYARMKAACRRVVVGGESTGGLLALWLAQHHPEIEALLLYAPALRLNLRPLDGLRMRLLAPFVPWVRKANLDSNPYWQGYPVNPLKGVLQLLALQRQVRPRLGQIRQPMLLIQGRLDKTVHPSVPDVIAQAVASSRVEKHWMSRSPHCVIIDQEMDEVARLTLDFLRRTLAAPAENDATRN